ncbi:hypothetical protein ACQP00_20120 [Dactylosporangium sp. CS-047395]|uniref:hypothetical protein n=1 Tax=Dactylosporangium sp. CS-047395 TaxID=3239936 RepID=UPI003D8C1C1C
MVLLIEAGRALGGGATSRRFRFGGGQGCGRKALGLTLAEVTDLVPRIVQVRSAQVPFSSDPPIRPGGCS